MRVIWISVGLLLVVGMAGFLMFETEISESLEVSQQANLENPFVDETPAGDSAKTDIDLVVLPNDASSSDSPPNVASAETSTSSDQSVRSTSISKETNEQIDQAILVEDTTSVLAEQPAPEAIAKKEKKKLGLSMLAFEKEKKKNKVAVIIHENNSQQLTAQEIKALYLDRLTRWHDGSKVMLFNLPLGDKYRDKFSKSVLKMSALEADKQESKRRELRIKANDVEVKSKNVVISYVEQHPNAVAYVPLSLVRDKSNVKVILTIP